MNKIITVLCMLYGATAFAQSEPAPPVFPSSFQLDKSLLPGFQLAVFDETYAREGFMENPGVVTDRHPLQIIVGNNTPVAGIKAVYYEVYHREDKDYVTAGVQVFQFEDHASRQQYLDGLTRQPNYAILLSAQHYLIEVWSNDGYNDYELLDKLTAYYQQQVGAELQTLREDDHDYETEVEAVAVDMSEAVDGNGLPVGEALGHTGEAWETDSIGMTNYDVADVDKEMWSANGLTVIEDFQPEADYQLYRTETTNEYVLWCIGKNTPDEWTHWGILFDKQGKLLGYRVFAYGNSEGFLSIYTKIRGDEIQIYTENVYKTEVTQHFHPYMMTSEGFMN